MARERETTGEEDVNGALRRTPERAEAEEEMGVGLLAGEQTNAADVEAAARQAMA